MASPNIYIFIKSKFADDVHVKKLKANVKVSKWTGFKIV